MHRELLTPDQASNSSVTISRDENGLEYKVSYESPESTARSTDSQAAKGEDEGVPLDTEARELIKFSRMIFNGSSKVDCAGQCYSIGLMRAH